MDAEHYRHLVAGLFPCATRRGGRTSALGVEHELLAADTVTGAAVPVARVRAAVAGAPYASYVGFEPGGQVELSWPCAPDVTTLAQRVRVDLAALRGDCLEAGIRLESSPVDVRPESEVPLQLDSPRYVAMQRHFDRIGPAGRRMMRRTASTQVCLDWWPGRAGLEQWWLLNLAGPFLAAAFARPGSDRLLTWLAVDPSRTAFDGRLLHGDDPVAAYAGFAAAAVPIVRGGDQHLTTLFPPVRPRGRYLEVRFPDVQEDDGIARLVAVLATLVHDDAVRGEALRLLTGRERRLEQHWDDAAHGDEDVAGRGHELVSLTRVRLERAA
jgi:gamma-glutamylcysteine synthetase